MAAALGHAYTNNSSSSSGTKSSSGGGGDVIALDASEQPKLLRLLLFLENPGAFRKFLQRDFPGAAEGWRRRHVAAGAAAAVARGAAMAALK